MSEYIYTIYSPSAPKQNKTWCSDCILVTQYVTVCNRERQAENRSLWFTDQSDWPNGKVPGSNVPVREPAADMLHTEKALHVSTAFQIVSPGLMVKNILVIMFWILVLKMRGW